jgi:hypothetical protein
MNQDMIVRGMRAALALAAIPAFLSLAGCYSPHVVNSQDTRYCESQGFRPGTDANYQCARDREAGRDNGTVPALDPVTTRPMLAAAPPPDHVGGVTQTTPRTVPPGSTRMINFSISVNSDCAVLGVPKLRIGEQPAHGMLTLIKTTDFARLSQIGAPPACADKRVLGAALLYTARPDYLGDDLVQIEVTTPGGRTYFNVPITVGSSASTDSSDNDDSSDE